MQRTFPPKGDARGTQSKRTEQRTIPLKSEARKAINRRQSCNARFGRRTHLAPAAAAQATTTSAQTRRGRHAVLFFGFFSNGPNRLSVQSPRAE
jgi:hypothetical protein